MNGKVVKIDVLSTQEVQFYTVVLGANALSEFESFDAKSFPKHAEEIRKIYGIINEFKQRRAKSWYFKDERYAEALPFVTFSEGKKNKDDFGIRLYCKRLSEDKLILLNGDIKTTLNPSDCPNVSIHFSRANKICRKIDQAIANGEIDLSIDEPFEDFEFDI